MSRSPRRRSEPILTKWLLLRYALTGLYVSGATLGAVAWWFHDHGVSLRQMVGSFPRSFARGSPHLC